MRVIALLSLIFGFMAQMILDGQTFTHAVFGIICGVAAVACALRSVRKDCSKATFRWEGRIMAGLGSVLAAFCVFQLPSAYRFQKKFNDRKEQRQKLQQPSVTTNNAGR